MEKAPFSTKLIPWYQEHQRDLPWRQTKDPYKIWLSEVILQQTRVAQGIPYYQSFCDYFPTVQDLAKAPESRVLRLWQGLGYYSRARNLHKCAKVIVADYQGKFPETYQQLIALPGIGDYTASAIASIAFNQPTPVVDGNVFRVLSRIFGIKHDISHQSTKKIFRDLSQELMADAPPDQFNQAIMEFGALHCTPTKPGCSSCPFIASCFAYKFSEQNVLPIKSKKAKVKNRFFYYFVIKSGDYLLMNQRINQDIWKGLYDFFLVETEREAEPMDILAAKLPEGAMLEQLEVGEPSAVYGHKLTHQQIRAQFMVIEIKEKQAFKGWSEQCNLRQFDLNQVEELPKPILIDKYLKAHIF